MSSWILVPCLDRLRDEFNEIAPSRDHASDGTIADENHASTSDHTPDEISDALRGKDADRKNEVHALDVDADLRTPGLTMERVVQFLLARCRSGAEKRLRYIIYNRRIWSASSGWREQRYTGPNPHDKHAHFSSSYATAREASTASWHLEDIPVALTSDDKAWLRNEIRDAVRDEAGKAVWSHDIDPSAGTYSAGGGAWTDLQRAGSVANDQAPKILDRVDALNAAVNEIKLLLKPISGK